MILQGERLFVLVRTVFGHRAMHHRAQNFLAVMHQHSVEKHRGESAPHQFFALELRRFENNVVRLPLALRPDRVHQRRPLPVERPGLPVRVRQARKRFQHLNLVPVHQQHAAVAAILVLPLDLQRFHPLDVQLHVAELIAREQRARSGRDFEVAFRHLPLRIHLFAALCPAPALHPAREVGAVEEHRRIRRRRSQYLAGLHHVRVRPVGIVDMPGLAGQNGGIGVAGVLLLCHQAGGEAKRNGANQVKGFTVRHRV